MSRSLTNVVCRGGELTVNYGEPFPPPPPPPPPPPHPPPSPPHPLQFNRSETQDLVLINLTSVDLERLIVVADDASLGESVGGCSPRG